MFFKPESWTSNWSLRQGDEEVNKRIKQKIYYLYLNKLPNISVWKQTFFSVEKKNENITKSLAVRISLPFHIFLQV